MSEDKPLPWWFGGAILLMLGAIGAAFAFGPEWVPPVFAVGMAGASIIQFGVRERQWGLAWYATGVFVFLGAAMVWPTPA